ncbi:hypothetical protein [Planotetraspora sp. GP83]|uniref:hypothetical protein n=1 Tax=Planotetraspora sp. GP83 TaxID=3156264 RepID=UPI0035133D21
MSPARVTLQQLLDEGVVEPVARDEEACRVLVVEYRAGVVHHADAEDAVALAEELLDSLSPQVTKLLDHPPPYRSRRA